SGKIGIVCLVHSWCASRWCRTSVELNCRLLALIDREEFIGKLQNDQGDGGAVRLANAVSLPRAVSLVLRRQEMVADAGEVFVPVFVAGEVKGLGGVELAVKAVTVFVPAVAPLETVPDVVEATPGDGRVVFSGVVQRGDGGGGYRQPRSASR